MKKRRQPAGPPKRIRWPADEYDEVKAAAIKVGENFSKFVRTAALERARRKKK